MAYPRESLSFNVEKVTVAGNHGPCMGVNRSIVTGRLVTDIVDSRESVYTNHPLVHNKHLAEQFARRGVIDVNNNLSAVPEGGITLLSAHGSRPELYEIARERDLLTVDTTCQLVTRVIDAGLRAQQNNKFVIYNGVRGHPEREAVMGHLDPDQVKAIEHAEDVDMIDVPEDMLLTVLSQTTLAQRETAEVVRKLKEKYGDRIQIPRTTLCYATTNRQDSLVELLKENIDLLIVLGSSTSHNTTQLRRIGEESGTPTYQIDGVEEIASEWFGQNVRGVGLTSGASVDEAETRKVIGYFEDRGVQVDVMQPVRDEHPGSFPIPEVDIRRVQERYPTRRDGTVVSIPSY
ncbi:MAG TPA: 4-hydroxy-3-methylbut-2-enyl diphosphate reductase, partial [Patescibacteria group bacterium]|nr:4-hydroxy-3-methylbut-2-enyl diphosphate reductase [Patescibacteria group bacterium]